MEAIDPQESLNEETVKKLLEKCRAKGDWYWIRAYLERALGSRIALLSSFRSNSFRTQLEGVIFLLLCEYLSVILNGKIQSDTKKGA